MSVISDGKDDFARNRRVVNLSVQMLFHLPQK